MLTKIKNWLPSKRKIMQLYFAVLFNANLKGFITGKIFTGKTKILCAPGINCYSCPGAIGACPLGSLQGAFSAKNHSTIYYVGGILLLYCIMFGRMICGWLCPFGLIQELVYKIKSPKLKKSPVTRLLSYLKYAILVFFVFIVPILYGIRKVPLPAFCKYICPAGTIEGGLLLLSHKTNTPLLSILGPLFTWKFLLMVSTIVGCIFIFRLFCRFICPLGALYGLFNKISVFGIKVDNSKCTHCGLCHAKCKVDIRTPGDQECISCGECVGVCPTKAIFWKGPKIFLAPNEGEETLSDKNKKKRFITRCISAFVMLAVLIGAIVYFWVTNKNPLPSDQNNPGITQTEPTQPGETEPANSLPPLGTTEGSLCYGADLPIINGTGDTGETVDPTKTGKLTIINFWGTWCGPCVKELPYFEQIAKEYGEQVAVIAIHSANLVETGPDYIAENYSSSPLIFSWETENVDGISGPYYIQLGGLGSYPYTIVLDENGVIVKIFYSSVHYEDLKTVVDEHLK